MLLWTLLWLYVCTKIKKFWNFYSGFETRDGCPSECDTAETKNRASKFFKLSMTITSSQGTKRMPHFSQTCWIQLLKALAWFIYWNKPARTVYIHIWFIFSDKPMTTGLSSLKPANNCTVGPIFPLFFHKLCRSVWKARPQYSWKLPNPKLLFCHPNFLNYPCEFIIPSWPNH